MIAALSSLTLAALKSEGVADAPSALVRAPVADAADLTAVAGAERTAPLERVAPLVVAGLAAGELLTIFMGFISGTIAFILPSNRLATRKL